MIRTSKEVYTTELCSYGCGMQAKYENGSGKLMCCRRHNSCSALRMKNSLGLKTKHEDARQRNGKAGLFEYKDLPKETKKAMAHSKGKTRENYEPLRRSGLARSKTYLVF